MCACLLKLQSQRTFTGNTKSGQSSPHQKWTKRGLLGGQPQGRKLA
jgi:hypothetical protein